MTTLQIIIVMFLTAHVSTRFVRDISRHPEKPLVYCIDGLEIIALAMIFKMIGS